MSECRTVRSVLDRYEKMKMPESVRFLVRELRPVPNALVPDWHAGCLNADAIGAVLMKIFVCWCKYTWNQLWFGGDGISCWPEQKSWHVCETFQKSTFRLLQASPRVLLLPGTEGSLRRAASASPSPWLWERRAGSTSPSAWPRGRRAGSTSPSPWLWERRFSADPSAPPFRVRESLCVRFPCLFLNILLIYYQHGLYFGFKSFFEIFTLFLTQFV